MGGRVAASVLSSSFLATYLPLFGFVCTRPHYTLVKPLMPTSGNTPTMAKALPQSIWLIHADSRNRDIVLIFITFPNTVIQYSLINFAIKLIR